jgi:hypothetical protein
MHFDFYRFLAVSPSQLLHSRVARRHAELTNVLPLLGYNLHQNNRS